MLPTGIVFTATPLVAGGRAELVVKGETTETAEVVLVPDAAGAQARIEVGTDWQQTYLVHDQPTTDHEQATFTIDHLGNHVVMATSSTEFNKPVFVTTDVDITADQQLATKKYVDDAVGGATGTGDRITKTDGYSAIVDVNGFHVYDT